LLSPEAANRINNHREELMRQKEIVSTNFQRLEQSPLAEEANQKAIADLKYPRRVLDTLLREANLYAVSPVLIFDGAHIKQRGVERSDFRYGVGGGLKFTFIGLNVTGGYVWNPNPRVQEGRGAFLFKFDVSDIFK
jgi:hypothetical protein